MLRHIRASVAPPGSSAIQDRISSRGWRGLAVRAAQILVGAVMSVGLIAGSGANSPALAAVQPPIGFERWTDPDVGSGIDFGLTAEQVFQNYAASLPLGGIPQTYPQKEERLIDIEIRAVGSGLAYYVYDVVWVKNTGDFKLDSWFLPGLTEADLKLLPGLAQQGAVAVDVERYPEGNQWRYSVILQQNDGHLDWDILTDASLQQVLDAAGHWDEMRILDLDFARPGPLNCQTDRGQACSPATFDAILVANSGAKAIKWNVWFNLTPEQLAAQEARGWRVVDWENPGDTPTTIVVKARGSYEIINDLDKPEAIFEHGHHGRVVDLEGGPETFSIVRFDWSLSPASPGLAAAHQGDSDDGQLQTRHRDGKAKGKTRHNRKPESRKSGKAGKHAKGRNR
jgi:hypothetical protein